MNATRNDKEHRCPRFRFRLIHVLAILALVLGAWLANWNGDDSQHAKPADNNASHLKGALAWIQERQADDGNWNFGKDSSKLGAVANGNDSVDDALKWIQKHQAPDGNRKFAQ